MKVVEDEQRVYVMDGDWSPRGIIKEIVADGRQEDPFYVMDLGEVVARYHHWRELMPRVEPFYAVKCNDDKLMVSTLAALGAGFDCASRAEMQLVTSLGVHPDRIIFANPAKMASHIRWANAAGVRAFTFDSDAELLKMKHYMPHAELVIRIRCDAENAQCPLGIKFGCDPLVEAPRLLKLAAVLGLNVIGVSFHVGSGAQETGVYARALRLARDLFVQAEPMGHRMRLVDIGGGFPGGSGTSIREVAAVINSALESHFPSREVRVIAEPGRYFAAAAFTLAAMVHATREIRAEGEGGSDDEGGEEGGSHTMYFINDGVYGSFNCVLYDHQQVAAEPLEETDERPRACSVWGPSCDGLDCVLPRTLLPPQRAGDWLVFRDMGAYTLPVASPFNGFPTPTVRAVLDRRLWTLLKDVLPLSEAHFEFSARPSTPPSSPAPSEAPAGAPAEAPIHHAVFVECALK